MAEVAGLDPGAYVVEFVYRNMQIDEEWSVRQDRGFCWWDQHSAQRVWAEPGYDDDGIVIYRLHAQADLVRNIDVTPNLLLSINGFNALAYLSALVADPDQRKVVYRASMWVHEQSVDWVSRLFQFVVTIQATLASNLAGLFAGTWDAGEPDWSVHPVSGQRPETGDVSPFIREVVVPAGREPSCWVGPEMAAFLDGWASRNVVLGSGDEAGLTLEFPYLDRTSLFQATTNEPNYGLDSSYGMMLQLSIPEHVPEKDWPAWANDMNRYELASRTRTNLLGSWTVESDTPKFVAFYPNAARFGDGLLTNILMNATLRAKWLAHERGDDWERPGRLDAARYQAARPRGY